MSTLYWLIESEEAKAKWDKLVADAEKKRAVAREWMLAQGGTGLFISYSGNIDGIEFETLPEKNWKENQRYNGYYSPKRNTKVGKELTRQMGELSDGWSREIIGETFLGHQWIFSECNMLRCGMETTDKGIVLSAKEGLGATQWKPIDGLRRLKDSEYWAIKETKKQTN